MSDRAGSPVILEARAVAKIFRDGSRTLEILSGVDLAVRAGEIVAIQGPSGSGKSTLLQILGALDRPTRGAVLWRGRDIARLSGREAAALRSRSFGFVFQFFHLLPELTALENVRLPARIAPRLGFSPEAAAQDLLARVGLSERSRHRPSRLSGGERQRVALARALLGAPPVVFCDEPTGNLAGEGRGGGGGGGGESVGGREAILRLVHAFREENGTAFVIATHDERLAASADRRLRLVDGRMAGD